MTVRHREENFPLSTENLGSFTVCCISLENATNIVRTVCQHYFHKNCLKFTHLSSCRQLCKEDSFVDVQSEIALDGGHHKTLGQLSLEYYSLEGLLELLKRLKIH